MKIFALALLLLYPFLGWGLEFENQTLDTGMRLDQSARVASLEGAPHLLLIGKNAAGEQQLQIYRFSRGAAPEQVLELSLAPTLLAMDVARTPSGEAVCFLDREGVLCLDFPSSNLRRVISSTSLFRLPRSGDIASLDFMQDLDGDDLDDLLIPDFDGLELALQSSDGKYSPPARLSAELEMTLGREVVRYRLPRIFLADANFDGHKDILLLEDRTLRVFAGAGHGGFAANGMELVLGLELASAAQIRDWENDRGDLDQSDLSIRRIERVADLNGDGAPDLLTESTHSRGVFDKSSDFAVHLGRNLEGWVGHTDPPDSLMVSKGMQFDLVIEDLDGDGQKDLIIPSVRLGLGRVIKALFSGSMGMDLDFYRADQTGLYPAEPNYSTSTKVKFDLKKGHADVPAVLVADFNGDGIKDLLVQQDREELKITLGDESPRLFGGSNFRIEAVLPRNGERVQPLDVNADGLDDLVMQYGVSDGAEMVGRLNVLLSREPASAGVPVSQQD
jgi:hypothetical protein